LYQPKHLKLWREQINYTGDNFDDYYVVLFRFFRCTPLERSNFNYVKELLSDCGVDGETMVIFPTFSDEVMMSRRYIMVHKDCERGLRMADMLAARIKNKGSLDPEAEQQLSWTGITKSWRLKDIPARVALCREAGISIFAARRTEPTHESLIELLSEAS
jgi:hypothetical protein